MHESRRQLWSFRAVLAALFVLALVTRTWRAQQEVIANPDVIRYIDQARDFGRDFLGTLRGEVYHPLHAWAAFLVHGVLRTMRGGGGEMQDRANWLWSLRVVGIVSGAVVTVEIVLLARLFGARLWAAVAAGLYFLVARRTSVYGADGLSDMLALAFFGAGMICGMQALRFGVAGRWGRAGPWVRWILAGFLAGVSYLARPEGIGAVIILAGTLWMLAVARRVSVARWKMRAGKWLPRRRLRASFAARATACLLMGALIPVLPYVLATHRFTGKVGAAAQVAGRPAVDVAAVAILPAPAVAVAMGRELFETLFWPGAVVLAGAAVWRPRLWGRARARPVVMVWTVVWVMVMAGVLLSPSKGYLDGRHTLPLQLMIFALLGLALHAWETPMRAWMNAWRRWPERWARLPAWMRWRRWPEGFAVGAGVLMMLPGMYEMSVRPRADKADLRAAAEWIRENAAENVVVADYERLVGFYSGRAYAKWWGTPEMLELHQLDDIRRAHGGAPVLVGMVYDPGAVGLGSAPVLGAGKAPQLALGPYRAIAAFESPVIRVVNGKAERHTYVLYALPEQAVLKSGTAAFLGQLPE